MTFTLERLLDSICGVLKENYSDVPTYSNPNKQGTSAPCFFVFFMPSDTENRMGRRYMRNIGIDIVYLVENSDPDMYDQMVSVADQLDFSLEFVPCDQGMLRTYDREWKIDEDELHYQFTVKAVVSYPDNTPAIESAESYEGGIKQDA